MAVDVRAALTRKLGPLPAWGWGVALGGGILAYRFVRGGSSSGQQAAASGEPTFVNPPIGGQAYNSEGFVSMLPGLLQALPDQVAAAVVNAQTQQPPAMTNEPTGTGNATPIPLPAGISWPSWWPTAARADLDASRKYALQVIQANSPGGSLYHAGKQIPQIPLAVIPLAEQRVLAKQYGGFLQADTRVVGDLPAGWNWSMVGTA